MAYHIININSKGEPEIWVNIKKDDLIDCDFITPCSIIYDTENNNPPFIASTDKYFNSISETHKRLGAKAEKLFSQQAFEHNIVAEKIPQDEESIEKYRTIYEYHVKRGDYYLRKLRAEIEVKCLKCYPTGVPIDQRYIYLNYYQLKSHIRMSKHTGDKCYLALYIKENDTVKEQIPRIFSLHEIDSNSSKFEYDIVKKALKIPLSNMNTGFEILHSISEDK